MSTSTDHSSAATVSQCQPITQSTVSTSAVAVPLCQPIAQPTESASTTAASQYSVAPVLVGSVASTGKNARSWAGRRRPYLQQNKAVTARSAAVSASEKITELSAAKIELAKLRQAAEEDRRKQAAAEHELRMKFMQEEHEMKKKEHEMRMLILQSQLQRRQNFEE